MKKNIIFTVFMLSALWSVGQNKLPVYLDDTKSIEARVEDALSRMTVEEKVKMCHAQSKFSSAGVPRLGIPELWMCDGPHGIRAEVFWDEWDNAGWTSDSCTAFPALTCLAATWNTEMSALYGKSIGEEARYRKKDMLLGPGVNIYRTPLNGRNFEYMGEDPYLASVMVIPYVKGVQSNGVAACVKHFALNNQEKFRDRINVEVSDRALHEIYLPAFHAAVVDAGAWAVMGSYNKYKGQHCCHNDYLLNGILKTDWSFDGVVVTDWGGAHDTKEAVYNGLDLEMGTWTDGLSWNKSNAYDNYYLAQPFLEAIRSGEISEKMVDEKVRRILRLVFRTNMDRNRPWGSFATEEHAQAGLKIAEEGIVLLKNEKNLLPLKAEQLKRIAVVGENAVKMMTVGGGSSSLKVKYEVSPLQGIQKRFGHKAEIAYAPGYSSEKNDSGLQAEAVKIATGADVVLFFGGLNKNEGQDSEGQDRADMDLSYGQDALLEALVKANSNVVVVLISGNAVTMPWVNEVPAIVQGWFCGSEAGNALASVLAGDVNPSGKLPMTFPAALKDNGAIALGAYPGDGENEKYAEDLFVGYRWMDKEKIKPLFSFGYGLSYTTFSYGQAGCDKKRITGNEKIRVTVPVKNTGERSGAEVVQLYVRDVKSSLVRPVKELKGFKKVNLEKGEEQTVSFELGQKELSFYDDVRKAWVAEPGKFEVLIGASSTDIRSKITFELY